MMAENETMADALAVTAIRAGDRERYRELVERHADKVFAIAWARLGDHSLAEEATQEAFIAGFRRLGLLGKAERFGAWISTITRHVAINLGIRNRGELQRRKRWALETEPAGEEGTGVGGEADGEGLPNPETLRRTLEELPAGHRECLVLFYLENRSVAECAVWQGISENAFKVRLHRARAALREALEARLETQLKRLRAPAGMASAVMLALPAGSGGWLGWSAAGSLIAKVFPLGFLLHALQVVAMLPGLGIAWWLGRKELANFVQPGGFRGHFYRRFLRRILWFTGGVVVLAVVLSRGLSWIVLGFAERLGIDVAGLDLGMKPYLLLLMAFTGLGALDQWRRLYCIRHPLNLAASLAMPVFVVMFASLLFSANFTWLYFGQGLFFLIMSFGIPKAAPRMDHSIFTRAAHGLLTSEAEDESRGTSGSGIPPHDDGLALARFMGSRLMIEDWWRLRGGGFELRLTRVSPNPFLAALPFWWKGSSRLLLRPGGRVEARLAGEERMDLAGSLRTEVDLPSAAALERRVEGAVRGAWGAVTAGDPAAAARWLGEEPETEIFRIKPERSRAMRVRVWLLRVMAVVMPLMGVMLAWLTAPTELRYVAWKKPVAITEVQVTQFLAKLGDESGTETNAWNLFVSGMYGLVGVPDRSLFPTGALAVVQRRLTESQRRSRAAMPGATNMVAVNALADRAFMNAVVGGLLTGAELDGFGLGRDTLRAGLRALATNDVQWWLRLQKFPVHGQPLKEVLSTRDLAARVQYAAAMKSLDLIDLGPVVDELARSQVLGGRSPTNRWTVPDLKEWDGLFVTMWGETLRDTFDALVILDGAGALDRIDREACIRGILRFHRGKGLFVPHSRDPTCLVRGDARDTWVAFASLRILGALDRVPDLRQWEFRSPFGSGEVRYPDGRMLLPWETIEAWCLREKLRRELRNLFSRADAGKVKR